MLVRFGFELWWLYYPCQRLGAWASRLEIRAALATAGRAHRLSMAQQSQAEAFWEGLWTATRAIELTAEITAHAGRLASLHALRNADAMHLASLLALGTDDTIFAVWDERLRSGALAAGVRTAPRA